MPASTYIDVSVVHLQSGGAALDVTMPQRIPTVILTEHIPQCHSTVSVRHEVFTVPANVAPEGAKAL